MNFTIQAIQNLSPNCQFYITNNNIDELVWADENSLSKPTKNQIEKEIKRLEIEYELNEYKKLRLSEYPSIEDQLDLLYHKGYEGWKDEIDKVKKKFPKPS
jgi:hypothetical protein